MEYQQIMEQQMLWSAVAAWGTSGYEIESSAHQGKANCVLLRAKVNHLLHLCLSGSTLGLWMFVWAYLSFFNNDKIVVEAANGRVFCSNNKF